MQVGGHRPLPIGGPNFVRLGAARIQQIRAPCLRGEGCNVFLDAHRVELTDDCARPTVDLLDDKFLGLPVRKLELALRTGEALNGNEANWSVAPSDGADLLSGHDKSARRAQPAEARRRLAAAVITGRGREDPDDAVVKAAA